MLFVSSIARGQSFNSNKLSPPKIQRTFIDKPVPANNPYIFQQVPEDFYAKHLTFFCRQEFKMQQVHIPLQVRVGSIDNNNYLEQKPGYKSPSNK